MLDPEDLNISAGARTKSKPEPGGLDVNGRGLLLVESLSREWGTAANDDGFKTVWASFALER